MRLENLGRLAERLAIWIPGTAEVRLRLLQQLVGLREPRGCPLLARHGIMGAKPMAATTSSRARWAIAFAATGSLDSTVTVIPTERRARLASD